MVMHSSLENSATAEPPASETSLGLSPQVPGQDGTPSKSSFSLKLAVPIALLVGVVLVAIHRRSGPRPVQVTALAQAGNNTSLLRLKGNTAAIESRAILAPSLSWQQVGT